MLSDINKVALAMEGLKDIQIAGSINKLNVTSLNAFIKGIDGLTLSQAQAALSTRALTDAQKEQILTSANLLKTKEVLGLEEVKQMASSMSLSAQKREEILTTLQGAIVENEWNEERLEAIKKAGGEAGAIAQVILAKKGENAENVKQLAGRKALNLSLKEELKNRLALMATNPVALITGMVVAGVALVALQEKLSKSLEECVEELEEYNSAFESAQSEVESLDTEIDTCTERIKELQKLADNGTISIVEQEELDRLKETNEELDRNLRIQKEKAQLSAIEGAETADETLGKKITSKYLKTTWYDGVGGSYEDFDVIAPEKELEVAISEYNRLSTEIDKLNESYNNRTISADDYKKQLFDLNTQQTNARTRASEMSDILVESEQAYRNLENTGGKLTTTQSNNLKTVSSANAMYNEFLGTINGVGDAFEELDTTEKAQTLKDRYANKTLSLKNGQGTYTVADKEISDWIDTLSDEDLSVLATINFNGEQTKESMEEALEYVKTHTENGNETTVLWDFTESMKQLDTMKGKLSILDETFSKLFDPDGDTNIGFEDYSAIFDAFSDVEGLDIGSFIQQLQDAGQDVEKVTTTMQDLIGSYLDCSGVLNNVTNENKDFIITMLEEMGVANAEEIVLANLNLQHDTLAAEKQWVSETTRELTDATVEEINEFIEEHGYSQAVRKELVRLALAKETVNGTVLDFSGDISNIISYVETLQGATSALKALKNLDDNNGYMPSDVRKKLEATAKQEVQNALKKANSYTTKSNIEISPQYKGGSSTQKAIKDTADEVKKAAEKVQEQFEETFDFFDERVEELDNAIDLLDANLENVVGSFAKNTLIDAQIGVNAEKINNYTDALAMYTEKANEALSKLPSDIAEKVKNGAVDLTTFIGDGNKEVVEAVKEYDKWSDSIHECQISIAELHKELENLELQKFTNIVEDFNNISDIRETGKDLIDQTKEWIEASGSLVGDSFYSSQIEQSQKQLSLLEEEKTKLVEQMNSALASGRVNLCPAV